MNVDLKKKFLPRAILIMAAFIWGSSFVIVKNTVDHIPPNFLLAIRFTFAAVALALVFHKRFKGIDKSYIWRGALMGLFIFMAYCLQTLGIQHTTPAKNAFLTAVYCILVPFVYWIVNGVRPSAVNFIAALMCLLGIGFISLQGDFSISIGDMLTLAGGIFYALHMVAVAKLSKKRDIFVLTVFQFISGAALAWAATLIFEEIPSDISSGTWGGVAYLSILCTAVALLLQNVGQNIRRQLRLPLY